MFELLLPDEPLRDRSLGPARGRAWCWDESMSTRTAASSLPQLADDVVERHVADEVADAERLHRQPHSQMFLPNPGPRYVRRPSADLFVFALAHSKEDRAHLRCASGMFGHDVSIRAGSHTVLVEDRIEESDWLLASGGPAALTRAMRPAVCGVAAEVPPKNVQQPREDDDLPRRTASNERRARDRSWLHRTCSPPIPRSPDTTACTELEPPDRRADADPATACVDGGRQAEEPRRRLARR